MSTPIDKLEAGDEVSSLAAHRERDTALDWSFGTMSAGKSLSEIEWKPFTARDLSALVEEEIEAVSVSHQAPPPSTAPDGIAPFAAAPPSSFAFGAEQMSWSPPTPMVERSRLKIRPWHFVVGGLTSSAVTALALLLVLQVTGPERSPRTTAVTSTVSAGAVVPAQGTATASTTTPLASTTSPVATATTVVPASEPSVLNAEEPSTRTPRSKRSRTKFMQPVSGNADTPPAVKGEGPADDISKNAAKKTLSKDDIMDGVKNGMTTVKNCIQGARQRGELTPGKHTLVLNWTIRANGTVANPSVKGPSYVLGTSLPECIARGMRQWTFPASQSDSPVKNFPFGPFNIK